VRGGRGVLSFKSVLFSVLKLPNLTMQFSVGKEVSNRIKTTI